MPLSVEYPPCPVGLIGGGGEGRYGLCGMELLAITQGEPIYPKVRGVNPFLAYLVITVNDDFPGSREERADLLWPVLPMILGTDSGEYPRTELAATLGLPYPRSKPEFQVQLFSLLSGYSDTEQKINLIAVAAGVYHRYYGTTPRTRFTPEELARLDDFISHQEGNLYLTR